MYDDSSGKALTSPRPVVGAGKVARFLLGLLKNFGPGYEIRPVWIDGSPAFAPCYQGQLDGVMCFLLGEKVIEVNLISITPINCKD